MATLEQRFWSKVDKSGGVDACWPWTACIGTNGYGNFKFEGKNKNAHRVAYELVHGPVDRNMEIRHHCDNKLCCNDSHLEPGTRLENVRDAIERGRHPHGESCGRSKLSLPLVLAIKQLKLLGCNAAQIGKDLQLAESTVRDILSNKTWKHLT